MFKVNSKNQWLIAQILKWAEIILRKVEPFLGCIRQEDYSVGNMFIITYIYKIKSYTIFMSQKNTSILSPISFYRQYQSRSCSASDTTIYQPSSTLMTTLPVFFESL